MASGQPTVIVTSHLIRMAVARHAARHGASVSDIIRRAVQKDMKNPTIAQRKHADKYKRPARTSVRLSPEQEKHIRDVSRQTGLPPKLVIEFVLLRYVLGIQPDPEMQMEISDDQLTLFD